MVRHDACVCSTAPIVLLAILPTHLQPFHAPLEGFATPDCLTVLACTAEGSMGVRTLCMHMFAPSPAWITPLNTAAACARVQSSCVLRRAALHTTFPHPIRPYPSNSGCQITSKFVQLAGAF